MFTCKHSMEYYYEVKRGTVMYNVFLCIIHIVFCFISTGNELCNVEQQTHVDKEQQQFGTDVASILTSCIAFELRDSDSGYKSKIKSCDFHVMMCAKENYYNYFSCVVDTYC